MRKTIPLIIFLAISLVACGIQTPSPVATPTTITPRQGLGGIRGTIQDANGIWGERTIHSFAARFYPTSPGNGFYVLEPALDPSVALEPDGLFQLNDLNPGSYVLVIGPTPEEGIAVRDQNQPKVVQVLADQITDLGVIELEYLPPPSKPYP